MKIAEYLRHYTFKMIDSFKKVPIHHYVNELQNFENSGFKKENVALKLKNLLTEAQSNTVFYGCKKGELDLNCYPVISKRFLIENEVQFQSVKYKREKLVKVSTSGSYGTPFSFYITPKKKKRQLAEVIYYGLKVGYKVGMRHGYFRTALAKSRLKLWLQNEIFIVSRILGDDFFKNSRIYLKKKKLQILIGFPSAIAMLAQHCIVKGDKPKDFELKGVLTFAENLSPTQRKCISEAFGCKVHSRYGTEELGILGCEYDQESGFELNTCNYIVEVLKLTENVTVLPGELGRVVVTDLHSNAFPLIRYETGDLAVLGSFLDTDRGWAKHLKTLSGRIIQIIYATNGEQLYPLYFENIIEQYNIFVQYQLIQETIKQYTLNLLPKADFDSVLFSSDDLTNHMRNWLGQDAEIKINLVKDIQMLPSGKRPSIINKLVNV